MIKRGDYNYFWRTINKITESNNIPLRVMFELTYRCNFKCPHCYIPYNYRTDFAKKELSTKEVFSILDQIAEMGCLYLGLTGGEPFIREDILDIILYARKKGFIIVVYSNGSLITKKIAQKLKQIGLYKLDITLPAMGKKVFEQITGILGSRNRVFNAINNLRMNRVNLAFKSCLLRDNTSEIKNIFKFVESIGSTYRLDGFISPLINKSEINVKHRAPWSAFSVLEPCSEEAFSDRYARRRYRDKSFIFSCGAGLNRVTINPCGQLRICNFIDYPRYDILGAKFRESWYRLNKLVKKINKRNYKCSNCKLELRCTWCPAQSWLRKSTFMPCIYEFKQLARYRIYGNMYKK